MTFKTEGGSYRPSVPITVARTLDESLDTAHVMLPQIDRREPFVPFSFAELDGERWLVGADVPTEVKGLRGRWNHDITLVEETKRLETMFISGKVITKHEYRDYLGVDNFPKHEIVTVHDPSEEGYVEEDIAPKALNVPAITGPTFTANSSQTIRDKGAYTQAEIDAFNETVGVYSSKPYALWVEAGGRVVASTMSLTSAVTVAGDEVAELIGNRFEVHYYMPYARKELAGSPMLFYEIKYTVTPVLRADRATNKTAREVVEELIADAEQLRFKDKPRIVLDPEESARLERIEAPEDTFPCGMTLFEAMLKIGDWDGVGGIPKLQRDVLTFPRWGSTEVTKLRGRVISSSASDTADDYCSVLESAAANMIDEIGNPVSDPFVGGYQTPRTEEGAVFIEDGSISIHTAFPIWQVVSLSLGYVGGKIDADGGDLTPYVYEKTEYDLLSGFLDGGFPNSKGYALYYTKGSPNIEGLSYVARNYASDLGWSKKSTIERILEVKFGVKPKLSSAEIISLPFRVTYIPYISTRVRQHRMSTNGIEAALAYGQGGNVISARTYGNHLRARAQMLGLPERTVILIHGIGEAPAPGARVDGVDYVGSVVTERYPDYEKSQVTLSPNYNRLNRFIEIKKDIRQYEIPMDGSTERNVLHEDYIVIGEREGKFPTMMSDVLQTATVNGILGRSVSYEIGAAVLTTSNQADKTDGVQVILPLVKMPIGNSVLFYAKYRDNYSAGSVSEIEASVGNARRFQRDVRYTDAFGDARYLHMDLVTDAEIGATADDVKTAHSVPLTGGVKIGRSMVTSSDKPLMLNKDARESISLTYQIHFLSNTDLIIGSEMAARAPWMAYKDHSPARVHFYRSYINPLTGETDATDGSGYELSSGTYQNVRYIGRPSSVPQHVSWAVKQDGAFLFGANSPMPERIFFNFRDKLREITGITEEPDIAERVFITFNVANATHVNVTDHIVKGEEFRDRFTASDGHSLPDTISVKIAGAELPPDRYTWDKKSSKSAVLTVPNVDGEMEISVFGYRSSVTIDITFEYWDEWGNDLLYEEHLRGTYLYGYTVPIPAEITREHKGEPKIFTLGRDAFTIVATDDVRTSVQYYLKPEPRLCSVEILYNFWDQWGNDLLYTETFYGAYMEGFKLLIKDKILHEHEGESREFLMNKEPYYVTVTKNLKMSEDYYLKPVDELYHVDIEINYWDQWGNQLLYTDHQMGYYYLNQTITMPKVKKREHEGEMREFALASDAIVITVLGTTRKSVDYYEVPVEKPHYVDIELNYWDQWGNQLLYTDHQAGFYYIGQTVTVPKKRTRQHEGEMREFEMHGDTLVITVAGAVSQSVDYYEVPVDMPYYVDIEYNYWDQWGNDLLYTDHTRGYYYYGETFEITAKRTRLHEEEMREFELGGSPFTVVVIGETRRSVDYYLVPVPSPFYVEIEYNYWDQWGNDLLYTDYLRGYFNAGHKIEIPATKYREHDGESRAFLLGSPSYTIVVTSDLRKSVDYYLYVYDPDLPPVNPDNPDTPTTYDVNISLELWDQYGNDLIYTDSITGRYESGEKINIPGSIEYGGSTYLLDYTGEGETITVTGDLTKSYTYYEAAVKHTVEITLDFWDEYGNDYLFGDTIEGEYEDGSEIVIPAVEYRTYNEEERAFDLQESSSDITITVDGYVRRSFTYNLRP